MTTQDTFGQVSTASSPFGYSPPLPQRAHTLTQIEIIDFYWEPLDDELYIHYMHRRSDDAHELQLSRSQVTRLLTLMDIRVLDNELVYQHERMTVPAFFDDGCTDHFLIKMIDLWARHK